MKKGRTFNKHSKLSFAAANQLPTTNYQSHAGVYKTAPNRRLQKQLASLSL
eukprot:m.150652 g.150652  ORF g.150652 m.150652 type:complete len:51 (+) comp16882_c1_seq2:824-976(+)